MSAPTTGVPFPVSSPVSDSDSNPDVPNGTDTNADPPSPTEGPGSTAHILEEAKQRFENQSAEDEELRESLGKMITLCNKLTSRISTLEPQLVELQTSLTLTRSNLTLALANTEMLEDALRHNAHTRDVGWRRSDSTASRRPVAGSISYSHSSISTVSGASTGSVDEQGAKIVVHAASPSSPPLAKARVSVSGTTTPTSGESRFFRFRFGSKTPSPTFPPHMAVNSSSGLAHLTSASLPSLGLPLEEAAASEAKPKPPAPADIEVAALEQKLKAREEELKAKEEAVKEREKELSDLRTLLEAEKKNSIELEKEKERVQDEIESLTQSLFEEANKMVADERRRMAEVEALLRETEEERDAVRGAMRVVEGENGRLRELSAGAVKKADEEVTKKSLESQPEVKEPAESRRASQESVRPAESTSTPQEGTAAQPDPESAAETSVPAESGSGTEELATAPVANGSGNTAPPPLPASSSDLWEGQAMDRETTPPGTPPRVYTLPVEASPWAEGQASA